MADFTPLSLLGASLHPSGKRGWEDVGGLKHVKEALVESLLWPGKVFFLLIFLFREIVRLMVYFTGFVEKNIFWANEVFVLYPSLKR